MAGRKVKKAFHRVHLLVLLLIVTSLQVSGDVIVRMAIFNPVGLIRIGLFVAGGALLFGYGPFLNVAPLDFGRVVGYIVTLLDRVGSESARIVAVRVTAGTGVHTLAHQITNRVSDLDRLPSVIDAADQRLGQPQPLVARLRQDRSAIGTGVLLVTFRHYRLARQIRKQNTLSCTIVVHAKAS